MNINVAFIANAKVIYLYFQPKNLSNSGKQWHQLETVVPILLLIILAGSMIKASF